METDNKNKELLVMQNENFNVSEEVAKAVSLCGTPKQGDAAVEAIEDLLEHLRDFRESAEDNKEIGIYYHQFRNVCPDYTEQKVFQNFRQDGPTVTHILITEYPKILLMQDIEKASPFFAKIFNAAFERKMAIIKKVYLSEKEDNLLLDDKQGMLWIDPETNRENIIKESLVGCFTGSTVIKNFNNAIIYVGIMELRRNHALSGFRVEGRNSDNNYQEFTVEL